MPDDVLIYADTERSATLRHEIPLAIGDPFLYVEADGRRVVLTNSLERDRLARAVPDLELVLGDELGLDDLVAEGLPRHEIDLELAARLCRRVDLRTALVPPELPVVVADRLRAGGRRTTPSSRASAARRSPPRRAWPRAPRSCATRAPRAASSGATAPRCSRKRCAPRSATRAPPTAPSRRPTRSWRAATCSPAATTRATARSRRTSRSRSTSGRATRSPAATRT